MTKQRTTIGQLTLNDIGLATVRVEYQGATIQGILAGMEPAVEIGRVWSLSGDFHDTVTAVTTDLTIGLITIRDLTREHPCTVIDP